MNPSTSGWIAKFGHIVTDHCEAYTNFHDLYTGLKKTGFIYGINVQIPSFVPVEHKLSEDEKAKINLLTGLSYTYRFIKPQDSFEAFLISIFKFYKALDIAKISFLNKILTGKKTSSQLEKLIDSRVFLEDNVISKTFNRIITNSLLFIDVLAFKKHLEEETAIRQYAQNLEYITINVTYHTLHSKEKNKNDRKLAQLFGSSLTFIDAEEQDFDGAYRDQLINFQSSWEKRYFMDVACLTLWESKIIEYQESEFIFGLGKDLGFSQKEVSTALDEITAFFDKNSNSIPFLKESNFAFHFYDSMSKVVNKLIMRNSKRLQKELSESRELMLLISKSTVKDLSADEKVKMQKHLVDIFKSIPSLAIFLLPGGAVLLPIFIKLIPKLLPSSFDDNRIDKNK